MVLQGKTMEQYFDLPGAGFTIRCKMYCSDSSSRDDSAGAGAFVLSGSEDIGLPGSGDVALPEDGAFELPEDGAFALPDDGSIRLPGTGFRHVILFCHGFAGHKDNAAAQRLAQHVLARRGDTALVIFNWPAHGDDAHECISLADCDAYLEAMLRFVRGQLRPEILDACATSFGGYLVLKYIRDHAEMPFRRLCLRCPAVVMHDVLTKTILTPENLETLAGGGIVLSGFDRLVGISSSFLEDLHAADITAEDFRTYADRILIVQGKADELVPFEAVQAFAAKNGIRFLPVEGADHRFLGPGQMEIVIESFTDYLGL